MQPVVQQMLGQYYAANKAPPSRIVYYRDGVAEGQYATVLDHEYRAIKAACAAMSPKYNPPVTFIVVTKRHHARFMAVDERLKDRSGNIPAGTVVDTGVTDPHAYDFFLNSHAGLLGTNRPGQYTVLVDENGFGSDGLQLLTYWTTFTYQRATRSVSYAAPAYYAHLAAFRGRLMVDVPDSDVESVTSGGTGGRGVTAEQIHPNFLNTMFYM